MISFTLRDKFIKYEYYYSNDTTLNNKYALCCLIWCYFYLNNIKTSI